MNDEFKGLLVNVFLFSFFFFGIAMLLITILDDTGEQQKKKPTKEPLTVAIIEDTLRRYHPHIWKVCDKFEDNVSDNDNNGERFYKFRPYKTELDRTYGVTHDGDYAYIHMTCEVTATYQWGAFTHVQEKYEYSTPKYTFFKHYNDLDLTFLELLVET